MKKLLPSFLLASLLVGCASSLPHSNLELFNDYTGGLSMDNATRLYWYTEYQNRPVRGSDYVLLGDNGWYQTSYRWEEGQVREVVREGMQLKDNELVPYRTHLRFNPQEEAVYQQFRVDGKILPLNHQQRDDYLQQAQRLSTLSKEQDRQGVSLFQGFWNGQMFATCSGRQFSQVVFEANVAETISQGLAAEHYMLLLGKANKSELQVGEVLVAADSDHVCIERPELIESE